MKNLKKDKNLYKKIGIAVLLFLVISGLVSLYSTPMEKPEDVSLSQLAQEINQGEVEKIEVEGNKLLIETKEGEKQESRKEPEASLSESLNNVGVSGEALGGVKISIADTTTSSVFVNVILPFLLPFLLIGFFIWFLMRQAQRGSNQAMSFGSSKARMLLPGKNKKDKITFRDVAGVKEAKEELYEVVEFLSKPGKFLKLGARIPRGFLLLGPPGTGKTLLAKAVAGEANVPFFTISGSEFVEMFVGVGASRVRDLFKQAKKNAPAIVFIDEIDAVGRQRGTGLGGGHDEREQTLNQILVEMDGFDTDTKVIVMAATNRPDVLDPALLRPGRFDRRVTIDSPDINEREEILNIHKKGKPIEAKVNMRQIAERTPGFAGADLANLVNEAAILTARRNRAKISMQELREAIEKVILGPERKSHVMTDREKKVTAYHEAGHALIASSLPKADPVQKVSIVSRGRAAGYTLNTPQSDERLHFKSYYMDQLSVLLAGYATEKKIFGEVTSGASNDLERATEITRKIVTKFGMSNLGPVTYGKDDEKVFLGKELHDQAQHSEKIAEQIDSEVKKIIDEAYQKSVDILKEKSDILEKITQVLLKRETIEKEEFDKIVKGDFSESDNSDDSEKKDANKENKKNSR
ncbi:MAG: ATP-dependent zinc metalloprotease FtsH [Patescibacteria group bacterium]